MFTEQFILFNNLHDQFRSWHFEPGMGFNDGDFWWGERKPRPAKHEGVDLAFFIDQQGRRRPLPAAAEFGPLFDGVVVKIFYDFLGKSILTHHPEHKDGTFYSLLGHTAPHPELARGSSLSTNQSIGTIAHFTPKPHAAVPHLHMSLLKLPPTQDPQELDWPMISSSSKILLVDPSEMLYTNLP